MDRHTPEFCNWFWSDLLASNDERKKALADKQTDRHKRYYEGFIFECTLKIFLIDLMTSSFNLLYNTHIFPLRRILIQCISFVIPLKSNIDHLCGIFFIRCSKLLLQNAPAYNSFYKVITSRTETGRVNVQTAVRHVPCERALIQTWWLVITSRILMILWE